MNTYIVYILNSYAAPKMQTREIYGSDLYFALQNSGLNYSEIVCVKLKLAAESVAGL